MPVKPKVEPVLIRNVAKPLAANGTMGYVEADILF
jgi:hypothetical protein